jgi:hypothetical protein
LLQNGLETFSGEVDPERETQTAAEEVGSGEKPLLPPGVGKGTTIRDEVRFHFLQWLWKTVL